MSGLLSAFEERLSEGGEDDAPNHLLEVSQPSHRQRFHFAAEALKLTQVLTTFGLELAVFNADHLLCLPLLRPGLKNTPKTRRGGQ